MGKAKGGKKALKGTDKNVFLKEPHPNSFYIMSSKLFILQTGKIETSVMSSERKRSFPAFLAS
jgi:hypothetical protein